MGKSKYSEFNNPNDIGKRNIELEKSRERLLNAVISYKKLLDESILLANRTETEKKQLDALLSDLNNFSLEVDTRSVGEGSRVIGSTSLNSILLLLDKINILKYQNYYLDQRLKKVEEQLNSLSSKEEDSSNDSEEG